ncbi:MAG: diguanylate cyclase, partial [Gemmatimonadetes bacterium]|nr:diguanylate cyclase [Gemmatimonadota bacterium]
MQYQEFIDFLQNVGKDPSRLIFEDELTGIHNRRFLHSYLEHRIRWDGDDYPLSLLVIDLDKFKQINDTHGHDIGDQVLTWIAALLGETAGEHGFPIRYGGDEFMMLLPDTAPEEARAVADRLLQRTRDRPFRVRDASLTLHIQLSIGVASAPEDGTDRKTLTQAADTALYHAKQSGRNQAASAGEIDLKNVFSKTALNRLKVSGIAGRDEQLAVVAEVLQDLTEGNSRFVVFEGAPGIGKTTLLQTVHHNFSSDESLAVAAVSGDNQEGYHPYYLAARILITLLNQRDDKGSAVLESLSDEEIAYLAHVLPQLGDPQQVSDASHSATRQAIFATLARFLPQVIEFRPLILIVDDLHFADEATLLLLRVLVERPGLTLFVCGASAESLHRTADEEAPPLEQLLATTTPGFSIQREQLKPLTAVDIAHHLRGVFPGLRMPDGFEQDLAGVTQGNPLFLGEIIRKLVTDQKVNLVGQEWTIEPLADGYLPRSLDEIVMEQIAALDEDERKLLEQASTFGEGIHLSVLTGSTELDESKVLEFLDRAEALGLISMDFQINDEVMRFLGKRVLEISYGAMDEDRRKELHEDVGTYQEDLYQQQLLPSASLLAYHFKRSANRQKAQRYELDQLVYTQTVFSSAEAAHYAQDIWVDEEEDTEERLDPASLPLIPKVLRSLMSTARNILLYPPESKAIGRSLNDVRTAIEKVLATNERLHLSQSQRVLLANGQRLVLSEVKVLATSFLELLTRCELQGIVFHRGITDEETRAVMMSLGRVKPEGVGKGFWRDFVVENKLKHIELHQTRYAAVRKKRISAATRAIVDEELGSEDLNEIPKILRALQAAATNIKL